ncbi:MAG TPA: CBS domain-containing protein [Nitrospiria bacterium]|nr:CBS domain-containing protein [Nitrospiria bacterium]
MDRRKKKKSRAPRSDKGASTPPFKEAEATRRLSERIECTPLAGLTAAHLMEKEVRSSPADASAYDLAKEMTRGNFGSIPIVDGRGSLIGIVSEFDLLEAVISGMDLKNLRAKEVMKHPFSAFEKANAASVLRFLQKNHLIHVPVTDGEGKVIGIVARRDLLNACIEGEEDSTER